MTSPFGETKITIEDVIGIPKNDPDFERKLRGLLATLARKNGLTTNIKITKMIDDVLAAAPRPLDQRSCMDLMLSELKAWNELMDGPAKNPVAALNEQLEKVREEQEEEAPKFPEPPPPIPPERQKELAEQLEAHHRSQVTPVATGNDPNYEPLSELIRKRDEELAAERAKRNSQARGKKFAEVPSELRRFWPKAHKLFSDVSDINDRMRLVHEKLGVSSLKDLSVEVTVEQAIEIIKSKIEQEKKAVAENWTKDPNKLAAGADYINNWLTKAGYTCDAHVATLTTTGKPMEEWQGELKGLFAFIKLNAADKLATYKDEALTPPPDDDPPSTEEESAPPPPVSKAPAKVEPRTSVEVVAGNPFKPATKESARLRMMLSGPSGCGKTFTALKIATKLAGDGKVAVIDTERGSAAKYADYFHFDTLDLANYDPAEYIKFINAAVKFGYKTLIIDSLSHAWSGTGGVLDTVEKAKATSRNDFTAWAKGTPIQNKLVDAILTAPIHIICTVRSKMEYILEEYTNENGRKTTKPRRVGLAPVQRNDIEYEFDVFAEINGEHDMTITKSRCFELADRVFPKAGDEVAAILTNWLG